MTSSPSTASPRRIGAELLHRFLGFLRKDTVGGALLLIAAAAALILANSPLQEMYFAVRDFEIGYEPWHLNLSLGAWAADGLLAIFFFLVGIELKIEFVKGDLRRFRTAIIPIAAAIGGVLAPALVYILVLWTHPDLLFGWAIPTATDIAFAVAVLAIIGSRLPSALRIFLLTLAAVDDLLAISIIAIFYTERIAILPLIAAVSVIALFGFIAWRCQSFFLRSPQAVWVILLPLALLAWGFMHSSGVHATISGVLLGFAIPAPGPGTHGHHSERGLAEELEHRLRPLSAGFAVPIFAFFAAGVSLGGTAGLAAAFTHPLTYAVIAALMLGKPLGILAATWSISRFTKAELDPELKWIDLLGIGMLAGIGFTVSLLVSELSFPSGSTAQENAKVAVLSASSLSAILGALVLGTRNRRYGRLGESGLRPVRR